MSFEVFIKLFRTYCFGFMWLPFPNIKDFTYLFPIIAKARFYLSSQTLMTLYYSLVYPFLTYCNVVWFSTYCSNLNCIYLLQKCLVRLITKAHYLANTAPLFSQLKVSATLQDRPRADRCSVSCFYKNPYKPYIF